MHFKNVHLETSSPSLRNPPSFEYLNNCEMQMRFVYFFVFSMNGNRIGFKSSEYSFLCLKFFVKVMRVEYSSSETTWGLFSSIIYIYIYIYIYSGVKISALTYAINFFSLTRYKYLTQLTQGRG